MRVVLDRNLVVSAGRDAGAWREAIGAVLSAYVILVPPDVLAEYRLVTSRRKHASYLADIRDQIERDAEVVTPTGPPPSLPDHSDEVYPAANIAGMADALVTGDARHFPAGVYGTTRIVSPGAFQLIGRRPRPPAL